MEYGIHSNRQQEELDKIADMLGHSVTSKTQEGIAGCTASSRDVGKGDERGRIVEGSASFRFKRAKKEFGVYKQRGNMSKQHGIAKSTYFNQLQ